MMNRVSDQVENVRIRCLPDGRVSRSDAAAFLGCRPRTMVDWARIGRGPKPIKVGSRVFYRLTDLQQFASVGTNGEYVR